MPEQTIRISEWTYDEVCRSRGMQGLPAISIEEADELFNGVAKREDTQPISS